MGSRVELFEQIRRDREFEGLSLRALAEKYGVHRRTVSTITRNPQSRSWKFPTLG
jgi:transcriptional regulator with XRE-family HTH domain